MKSIPVRPRAAHLATAAALLALLAGCASGPSQRPAGASGKPPPPSAALPGVSTAREAVANLASASGSLVSGRVLLHPVAGGVRVTGTIGGLGRNAAHGLHVHARGDCSRADASSAGAYFDAVVPGRPIGTNTDRIIANADGVATVDLLIPGATLGGGAASDIAGRALVVLGATRTTGSARVACAVITPRA